jgi:alkaline phosphatase
MVKGWKGFLASLLLAFGLALALEVKVYPYDQARLLAGQRFDLLVILQGVSGDVKGLEVSLDGKPLEGFQARQGEGSREYLLRDLSLTPGTHSLRVVAEDAQGQVQTTRRWESIAPGVGKVRNVILFIGDGMGWQTVNAARIVAKGYNPESGMPRGLLAMEEGLSGLANVLPSSLNSFVADSANSAASLATGQKLEVNALNVYPDTTKDNLDNPRVETIAEMLKRARGASIGVVTTTFGTDATPAAWNTHTRRRSEYQAIADQYFGQGGFGVALDVMLFGGARDFIPKSAPGSRRKDETDWIKKAQEMGYAFVSDRTELLKVGVPKKLFGLFHIDNFPSYLDRAVWRRPEVLKDFTDMPYLWEMTQKAVEVLSQNLNGFFLMVEGGMVDKYQHPLDWYRGVWDVLELDKAVAWAKAWAEARGDTLVLVTADHSHGLTVYGGYDHTKGPGNREAVGVYEAAGFPTYGDKLDSNGLPRPETARGLAVGFGDFPDYCETFTWREVYQDPTISDGKGGYVPNPEVCKEPGAFVRTGNLPKGASQGVHTAEPVPLFAFGPGGEAFRGVMDQTQVFFLMAKALGLNPYLGR